MELENKEFIAILTINSKEKLKIRCRLHHVGENEVMATVMIYCQGCSQSLPELSTQLNQLDIIDVSLSASAGCEQGLVPAAGRACLGAREAGAD